MISIRIALASIVALSALHGCAATATDRAGHGDDAASGSPSARGGELRPSKLENCLTAVGADRTQCVAKEK